VSQHTFLNSLNVPCHGCVRTVFVSGPSPPNRSPFRSSGKSNFVESGRAQRVMQRFAMTAGSCRSCVVTPSTWINTGLQSVQVFIYATKHPLSLVHLRPIKSMHSGRFPNFNSSNPRFATTARLHIVGIKRPLHSPINPTPSIPANRDTGHCKSESL
jgi:hypothetical protein